MPDKKIITNTDRELIVLINREGFELDWQETDEKIDERQIPLQERLYVDFLDNAYKALFYIGFLSKAAPMPDSVLFIRNLSASLLKRFHKIRILSS